MVDIMHFWTISLVFGFDIRGAGGYSSLRLRECLKSSGTHMLNGHAPFIVHPKGAPMVGTAAHHPVELLNDHSIAVQCPVIQIEAAEMNQCSPPFE